MTRLSGRLVTLLPAWTAVLVTAAPRLHAQDLSGALNGEAAGDTFSAAVSLMPDLDGDGLDEVLVGAPGSDRGAADAGSAYLCSGKDGSFLQVWDGAGLDDLLGSGLCVVDDFDGDGFEDVLVGAPNYAGSVHQGAAYLYSSASGALLHTFDGEFTGGAFGQTCARLDDFDGDGTRDLVVGSYGASAIYVYSGKTAALLLRLVSSDSGCGMGWSLGSVDDLDGDGAGELVVGSPSWRDAGGIMRGRVEVLSSADGSLLQSFEGENTSAFANDSFGWSIATVSDVDSDGLRDLAIGAWRFGDCQQGRVYLHSIGTGALLRVLDGELCGDQAGLCLASAGDADGDGAGDLWVGTPNRSADRTGHVSLRSGATMAEITAMDGAIGDRLGSSLLGGIDFDRDGTGDVLVGALGGSPVHPGTLFSYALRPPRLDAIAPARGFYRDATPVTVTGGSFHTESGLELLVGGVPVSDLVVVDETTLACTVPAGLPAILDVEVRCGLGSAQGPPFFMTPVVTVSGDYRPGGSVTLSSHVAPGDTILVVAGIPPETSIDVPPFDSVLRIDPYVTLVIVSNVPTEQFDIAFDIPDDAIYSGLTVLFQELAGPKLGGRHKDGAWTNAASITIQ